MTKRYGKHPISKDDGYTLFIWWMAKHDWSLDLSAHLMGVSRRSAQRWVQNKAVPIHVAVALEQIKNGPAVQASLGRGSWVVRLEWRRSVEQVHKQYRLQGI